MMTPEELKRKVKESKFAEDMDNALRIVDMEIRRALKKGDIKIILPTNMKLGNLSYIDEKQDALAKKLLSMGYNCKKESRVIGGVQQKPQWYLYFE